MLNRAKCLILSILLLCVVASTAFAQKYDIVVAQDGSGDFTSVQDAIYSCKHFAYQKTVIFIKNGNYKEKIEVPSWITDIVLLGENKDSTIITNDDYSSKITALGKLNTYTSYTLRILGYRTQLINLTIENNAPLLGQAVALHIEADDVLIRNCKLLGNQDTLYANGEKEQTLIIDSYIEGTTDFIFGSAQLFMDNCEIHCKKNSYITAASTPKGREFGYAIFNSHITANKDVTKMYLGRPWRVYAKTVFIDCTMGDFIHPAGWHNWKKPDAESTVLYGEYNTKGCELSQRVGWSKQLSKSEGAKYYKELKKLKKRFNI